MNKIGEGYYYNVYDLGNGRVLKKQKSNFRLFMYILVSTNFNFRVISEYKNALINLPEIKKIYTKLQNIIPDMQLLGNPQFLNGINYKQDKVVVFKELLKSHSEQEIQKYLDQYIDRIKELWTYGVHEKVFNFTINTGIDDSGRLILIDFNEISFDINYVRQKIQEKRWLKSWSYMCLPTSLKSYYSGKMDQEITMDNLKELWRSKFK